MSQVIGSYEAKTKLPEILRRVEAGESFTITNRGRPIAEISPCDESVLRRRKTAVDNILAKKKSVVSDEQLGKYKAAGRK